MPRRRPNQNTEKKAHKVLLRNSFWKGFIVDKSKKKKRPRKRNNLRAGDTLRRIGSDGKSVRSSVQSDRRGKGGVRLRTSCNKTSSGEGGLLVQKPFD